MVEQVAVDHGKIGELADLDRPRPVVEVVHVGGAHRERGERRRKVEALIGKEHVPRGRPCGDSPAACDGSPRRGSPRNGSGLETLQSLPIASTAPARTRLRERILPTPPRLAEERDRADRPSATRGPPTAAGRSRRRRAAGSGGRRPGAPPGGAPGDGGRRSARSSVQRGVDRVERLADRSFGQARGSAPGTRRVERGDGLVQQDGSTKEMPAVLRGGAPRHRGMARARRR